jgi:spermidine synthase
MRLVPSTLGLEKKLFHKQSSFQKIEVYQTEGFGKSLFLDGIEQFSEVDEIQYHHTMAKVPILVHGNPKKILIIGGGDGATARECIKYNSIEEVDLCEIDEEIVNTCKKYFPQMACSFKDPKVNLIIEDGKNFVKTTKGEYDIILVDSTDPLNQSSSLFKKDFYQDLKKILKKDGVVSCQVQTPAVNPLVAKDVYSDLYSTFEYLNFFFCTYIREGLKENTLFSLCLNKQIKISKDLEEYFDLENNGYKRAKNFLNKLNWIKR